MPPQVRHLPLHRRAGRCTGLILALFLPLLSSMAAAGTELVVGVAADGWSNSVERHLEEISSELEGLLDGEERVVFKRDPAFNADWEPALAATALENALADPETDLVLCLGVLTTLAAAQAQELSKPVISGLPLDPELFPLPMEEERSAKENFTFVALPGQVREELETFGRIVRHGELTMALDRHLIAGAPELAHRAGAIGRRIGFDLRLVPMGDNADSLLSALPPDARAVYLAPPLRMDLGEWRKVVHDLARRGMLSFSMRGEPDVRLGILAGSSPDLSGRLSRRVALNIRMVLDGADLAELPVTLPLARTLHLNMRTAELVGWAPPFAVMLDAVLVERQALTPGGRPLTLVEAMEGAVSHNPGVTLAQAAAAEAEEAAGVARSGLLPQLSGDATWQRIDRDRAEASLGIMPMRRLAAGVSLEQAIFDDAIISRYRQARRAFDSALLEREAAVQDIMLESGLRYLALISSQSLLRIEHENLALTQRNLQFARNRRQVGAAGPEEVLRFETMLSEVRSRVIQREAQVRRALTSLNRSMGLSQTTPLGAGAARHAHGARAVRG
jgi:outer membrane protein